MHDNGVTLQKKVLQNLDIPYSYELAKRMEQYRSHPTLGYRPAGSKAEFETGEMLKTEMEKIGLSEVTKDAVTVDGWEFHKAALSYTNAAGETVSAELGAYLCHRWPEGIFHDVSGKRNGDGLSGKRCQG
mgnify:CR=1 FL=1